MSSATCHKCKVTIPLNQMNICNGKKGTSGGQANGQSGSATAVASTSAANLMKRARSSEGNDACKVRFCDTCLIADSI